VVGVEKRSLAMLPRTESGFLCEVRSFPEMNNEKRDNGVGTAEDRDKSASWTGNTGSSNLSHLLLERKELHSHSPTALID
jgi:hypothetical protein